MKSNIVQMDTGELLRLANVWTSIEIGDKAYQLLDGITTFSYDGIVLNGLKPIEKGVYSRQQI